MVPSLTVIAPVARMPKVRSDVPAVNGTLPVPMAGAGVEADDDDEADVADELELPDDDDEPELV